MPSRDHETYVELFRQRPQLAVALLRVCGAIELPSELVELGSSDLSQVVPTEFRADAVVVVRDDARRAVAGIVIEVQTSYDADKRRTWPLYVAALRASLACPVLLLVLAPDLAIARWARQPIPLGHPNFVLEPFVVGLADIPRMPDPDDGAPPELVVLSARAHPDADMARVALAAIDRLPEETRKLYSSFVMTALPDLIRQVVEVEMNPEQMQAAIKEMWVEVGVDRGRAEGLQVAALELIRIKLGNLPSEIELQVRAIRDVKRLTDLVIAIGQAADAEAIRAVVAGLEG